MEVKVTVSVWTAPPTVLSHTTFTGTGGPLAPDPLVCSGRSQTHMSARGYSEAPVSEASLRAQTAHSAVSITHKEVACLQEGGAETAESERLLLRAPEARTPSSGPAIGLGPVLPPCMVCAVHSRKGRLAPGLRWNHLPQAGALMKASS